MAAANTKRGRKAKLTGRLAKVGARGLKFARATAKDFAQPPAWFCDVARDAYWTIATDIAEAGELSRSDAPLIEMASRAYARWAALDKEIAEKKDETSDKGAMSLRAQARSAAAKEYRSCVSELGLSPVTRIKTHGALQPTFFPILDAPSGGAGESDGGNIYRLRSKVS